MPAALPAEAKHGRCYCYCWRHHALLLLGGSPPSVAHNPPQSYQGQFAFFNWKFAQLLKKKKVGNPQPNAKRSFARVKGLRYQLCHGLRAGARWQTQTLTQELSAIPRSALNQQVEKSPSAPSPRSSTHTGEPPGQDFSSLPIFYSSCPLRAAEPQQGSGLLPGGGSPGRDARAVGTVGTFLTALQFMYLCLENLGGCLQ